MKLMEHGDSVCQFIIGIEDRETTVGGYEVFPVFISRTREVIIFIKSVKIHYGRKGIWT
jgi:hypothetical protein